MVSVPISPFILLDQPVPGHEHYEWNGTEGSGQLGDHDKAEQAKIAKTKITSCPVWENLGSRGMIVPVLGGGPIKEPAARNGRRSEVAVHRQPRPRIGTTATVAGGF